MVANGAFTRTNGFGAGDGATVYPRFYLDQVEDALASQREGRPIFHEEERVEIIMAGNAHTRPVHRVNDEHRQRWPKEYERFKQGLELALDGTPLEEWPRLRRAQVLELKALGFMTVEQLAEMSDHAIQRIPMYGRDLKKLAAAFLDDAQRNALVEQTMAENARKDAEIASLKGQVANLGELLERLQGQVTALQNAPSPIATAIPGMIDPAEIMKSGQAPAAGASSLASLAAPRRRGQKPAAQSDALV